MTRYVLAGHFGPGDRTVPDHDVSDTVQPFDLVAGDRALRFGIGSALRHLLAMGLSPSEVGLDLLVVAAHVYAADTRITRAAASQDGWTREIDLVIPVSDERLWRAAAPILDGMLRFLTGDHWRCSFRPRHTDFSNLAGPRSASADASSVDGVCLFSGGLDSLIGAIDCLAEGRRPLFVSHAGEGAVSKPQRELFGMLEAGTRSAERPNAPLRRLRLAMSFPRGLLPGVGGENSTRSRSFLFLASGAFAGSSLGKPFEVTIPENGFIALNVPLDPTRLGANSTRTTHPFYLHRWDDFLRTIGIDGMVRNPYWDRTKGEMVRGCARPGLLRELVPTSVSCAHPSLSRYHGDRYAHCGHCVPCLIRRAAIQHAWGAGGDPTGYRLPDLKLEALNPSKAEGLQVRGFQYAIARLAGRLEVARVLIHKPGPLREDAERVEDLAGVYLRGMHEVERLLTGVRTRPPVMPEPA
ncbi:MAG: Qat anti-phage system QueC-like protein QatC [Janthinobacterium lividum]